MHYSQQSPRVNQLRGSSVHRDFSISILVNPALTLCMVSAGLTLFWPALDWAWNQVARPDRQYHIVVCIGVLSLCAYRFKTERHKLSIAKPNALATTVVLLTCIAYLLNQHFMQLNALSVALFLLFCFGLLGHFVSHSTWCSCTLPLILAMLVLPFEGYLDIFLGFPMRLLGAEVAAFALQVLGIASVNSDTVLLIDNRAAIVDIDCSGIKGFWIGAIFICAITWIERYKVDRRWAIIMLIAAMMLFAGNVFRIIALVWLDLVLNKSQWAQVLHESLGLISFSIAVFVSWQLMRIFANSQFPQDAKAEASLQATLNAHSGSTSKTFMTLTQNPIHIPRLLGFNQISITTLLLTCTLIACNLVLISKTVAPSAKRFSEFDLADASFVRQELNTIELQFFNHNKATAYKYTNEVELDGIVHKASVLVVLSGHWKAQHKPEHCYIAQGFSITSSKTLAMDNALPVNHVPFRQLKLSLSKPNAKGATSYTSDYWFQSSDTTTVNYARRVLSQIRHPDQPWAMVSVLWHEGVPMQARQQLLTHIRRSVTRNLNQHG